MTLIEIIILLILSFLTLFAIVASIVEIIKSIKTKQNNKIPKALKEVYKKKDLLLQEICQIQNKINLFLNKRELLTKDEKYQLELYKNERKRLLKELNFLYLNEILILFEKLKK